MISCLIDKAGSVWLCANCNNGYVNNIDLHMCSSGKGFTLGQNLPVYLRRLDKASLTLAFLGEERVDYVSLLSDYCTRFWYLCLPALHSIWLICNS